MKNSILNTHFILILSTILLLVSCSGEDGEDGQDGNANVIISEWFPSEFSNNPSTLELTAIENEIFNEETVSNAVVLVYGNRIDGVFALPVVFDEESYFFFIQKNTKTLNIVGQNINNTPSIYSSFEEFRYVIIPRDSNSTGKNNHPNFHKMSYEEVIDYFNILN